MSLLYEKVVQEDLNTGTSTTTVTNPGGGQLTGTQIGIHTFAQGQAAVTEVWDPGNITTLSYETEDVTVPGAAVGDYVMVSLTTMVTNAMQLTGHVSAADTVKCVLFNPTAGSINLGVGTLCVLVFKSR